MRLIRFFLAIVILGGINLSYSQSLNFSVNDSKRKQERIRKQKLKDSIANSFEHFALNFDEECSVMIEKRFIKRGDSVKIRYLFRPNLVKMISSRNLGREMPYECLKKGEWLITVKPDSTMWIDLLYEDLKGSSVPGGFLIIVIDPEKYDDVKREYDKVKNDYAKREAFLDSLGGKTDSEYYREELKRAGYNIP